MTAESLARPLPARLTVVGAGSADRAPESPPRVLLLTEGTYPFHWGGVSTWCDALVRALSELSFTVLAIASKPGQTTVFERPPNVVEFTSVPLWGVQDVKETWPKEPAADLLRSRRRTSDTAVAQEFAPALRSFLRHLLTDEGDGHDLAADLHRLYVFLKDHDLDRALRSEVVWQVCTEEMRDGYAPAAATAGLRPLELWELTTGFQWLSRWLFPLARELPEVDVVHASTAGPCSLVAVVAKLEHGAGYFLTEHGVYLRERYLAEADRRDSYFLKMLALRFARRTTEMSYALADQISPCCDYNQRWERQVGAETGQLETIYYGMDGDDYEPGEELTADPHRIVWVGRINPLKDVETLLRAAALVVAQRPDVRFKLYGDAPAEDEDYRQRCLALHAQLGLQESVEFCGFTSDPASAYKGGDIVVLSSVSEGFPYSTLEAMLCGRPVVATAVGGVPEQIEGAGIAVEPRNPEALAEGILDLVADPGRCRALGAAGREKASGKFAATRFRGAHYAAYLRLSPRHGAWSPTTSQPGSPPVAARVPRPRRRPLDEVLRRLGEAVEDVTVEVEQSAAVGRLADVVRDRCSRPVDALEIAAVVESTGVTDPVAVKEYGHPDTFRLADSVFRKLRAAENGQDRGAWRRDRPDVGQRKGSYRGRHRSDGDILHDASHLDSARHPALALLPTGALLTLIWLFTSRAGWQAAGVLSLAVGMTSGMLFTGGLALAMGRRASSLVSLGRVSGARSFVLACSAGAVLITGLLGKAVLEVGWDEVSFLREHQAVYLTSAVSMSLLWMLAAALSLVARSGWTGVALLGGLAVVALVDVLLAPLVEQHLAIAAAAGFGTAVAIFIVALERALRAGPGDSAAAHAPLPSRGYLMLEGAPYFAYGALGVVVYLSVRVVGWEHLDGVGVGLTTLELGLFLPLFPTVLGAGWAERTLRRFWVRAGDLQGTAAGRAEEFGVTLGRLYRAEVWVWTRVVAVSSAVAVTGIEVLIASEFLAEGVVYTNAADLRAIYLPALLGYALLGWGQFNAMFCLSLLRPSGPLRATLASALVTILAAVALAALFGPFAVGFALLIGAAVLAAATYVSLRRLLARADYHYVAAL